MVSLPHIKSYKRDKNHKATLLVPGALMNITTTWSRQERHVIRNSQQRNRQHLFLDVAANMVNVANAGPRHEIACSFYKIYWALRMVLTCTFDGVFSHMELGLRMIGPIKPLAAT